MLSSCFIVQGHSGHPPQGLQGPGVPRLSPHRIGRCPLLQRALVHPPPHLPQVWTLDDPALEPMGPGLLLLIEEKARQLNHLRGGLKIGFVSEPVTLHWPVLPGHLGSVALA